MKTLADLLLLTDDLRERKDVRILSAVVVITDNAKYHHALLHKPWREEHVDGFALDYLPPYSPALNPIERIWELTRRRCLHNRYFPRLDAVFAAVEAEFDGWASRNEALRRLCAKWGIHLLGPHTTCGGLPPIFLPRADCTAPDRPGRRSAAGGKTATRVPVSGGG